MKYDHWVNAKKIHQHLEWENRSLEPSPFISVFDNEDDALTRVQVHRRIGRRAIFVAQINSQSLRPTVLNIGFRGRTTRLPAWRGHGGTIFLSTIDVRQYLGVQREISQASEWFALDYIPVEMITRTTAYN